MSALELSQEGPLYIVTQTNGAEANTFTSAILDEHLAILEKLAHLEGPAAVILTSNDPKSWCTGINLPWLQQQSPEGFQSFLKKLEAVWLGWAMLPLPTVGCLTGHTFAGGAILSAGLDFRLMRADRGWFCFSEIDVNVPFTPLAHQIIDLLPDTQALKRLVLTGQRIGGPEALAMKIVDEIHPPEQLFAKASELAKVLASKNRETYRQIKLGLRFRLSDWCERHSYKP